MGTLENLKKSKIIITIKIRRYFEDRKRLIS